MRPARRGGAPTTIRRLRRQGRRRTVGELAGEIWAEAHGRSDLEIDWRTLNQLIDLIIDVLARHAGKVIEKDPDPDLIISAPRRDRDRTS